MDIEPLQQWLGVAPGQHQLIGRGHAKDLDNAFFLQPAQVLVDAAAADEEDIAQPARLIEVVEVDRQPVVAVARPPIVQQRQAEDLA